MGLSSETECGKTGQLDEEPSDALKLFRRLTGGDPPEGAIVSGSDHMLICRGKGSHTFCVIEFD